jgi:hypothetical protein
MKKVFFLMLGIVIMAQGCQTESELTDADKEAMVQAVKQASQEYWAVWASTYDNETYNKFAKFIDVNSDQMWQTEPVATIFLTNIINKQDESLASAKSMLENRLSGTVDITNAYYSVLSNEKVLEVSDGGFSIIFKDSTESGPIKWVGTYIWANIDGEWKLQFGHNAYEPQSE